MQLTSEREIGSLGRAQRWGAGLSLACAVHCAALPLVAGWVGLGHSHSPDGLWLEAAMVGTAAVIGLATLGPAYRSHGRPFPLILLGAGLLIIGLAHLEHFHTLEAAAGITGALMLVAAQWSNRRCASGCCGRHLTVR